MPQVERRCAGCRTGCPQPPKRWPIVSEGGGRVRAPTTKEPTVCMHCDRPDLTTEQYDDEVRAMLERGRFMVQSVGGSVRSAEFSYTVGLTAHLLPELIVTGLRQETASRLLFGWATTCWTRTGYSPARRSRPVTSSWRLSRSSARTTTCSPHRGCSVSPSARCSSLGPTRAATGRGSRCTARARQVSRCSASGLPSSATSTVPTGSTYQRSW